MGIAHTDSSCLTSKPTPRERHGDDPPLKPRAPDVTARCARKAEVSSSSPEADTAAGETRIVSVLLWPIYPLARLYKYVCNSLLLIVLSRPEYPYVLANYAIRILRMTSMIPPRIPHEEVMKSVL